MSKQPLKQVGVRIYDEKDKKAFEELKQFLDENSNNYSDQETILMAIRMAYNDLKEHQKSMDKLKGYAGGRP